MVTVQPERRQRNRHMMIMKPVCVIIAICILAGYGTVSNSSSDLDTRMEEMPDTEIEEFNEMVQTEEVHADTYTREFTDIERGRMDGAEDEICFIGRLSGWEITDLEYGK